MKKAIDKIEEIFPCLQIYNQDIYSGEWLFRGQGNSKWNVTPSFLRMIKTENVGIKNLKEFYKLHDSRVDEFFSYLEEHQIQPFQNPKHKYSISFTSPLGKSNDDFIKILSDKISLSQHYGLETLYVDWTKDPLIAIWFAIEQWAFQSENENLVLWMIRRDHHLFSQGTHIPIKVEKYKATIEIIEESPTAKKGNKHSTLQKGYFSVVRIWSDDLQEKSLEDIPFEWVEKLSNIDELLLNRAIANDIKNYGEGGFTKELFEEHYQNVGDLFRRVEIDKKLIPEILNVLRKVFGKAGLYPSMQGCANNVKLNAKIENKLCH